MEAGWLYWFCLLCIILPYYSIITFIITYWYNIKGSNTKLPRISCFLKILSDPQTLPIYLKNVYTTFHPLIKLCDWDDNNFFELGWCVLSSDTMSKLRLFTCQAEILIFARESFFCKKNANGLLVFTLCQLSNCDFFRSMPTAGTNSVLSAWF